jgi:DNA-binding transcriptional LysR family regulator
MAKVTGLTTKKRSLSTVTDYDIRLLRVFRAVVESGGFSNAEVALNVSRSAISISMSDLEKRLDLRLCQRGRAGFALTDDGKSVYEATLQLMSALETFKTQANTLHHQLRGELSIGISDNLVTLNHMTVTTALKKLKQQADVAVQIRMSPPEEIEKAVNNGSLHVGLVPKIRELKGIQSIELYSETSYLYCTQEHPLFHESGLTEDMVLQYDAVASASAKPLDSLLHYRELHTTATSNDREGVAFLILTGEYIGFLPDHFAQQWVDRGQMRQLLPEVFQYHTPYHVITKEAAVSNPLRDHFIVLLKDI